VFLTRAAVPASAVPASAAAARAAAIGGRFRQLLPFGRARGPASTPSCYRRRVTPAAWAFRAGGTRATGASPGGPGERAAAQHVRVHMIHGLPAVRAGVE